MSVAPFEPLPAVHRLAPESRANQEYSREQRSRRPKCWNTTNPVRLKIFNLQTGAPTIPVVTKLFLHELRIVIATLPHERLMQAE